MVVWDCTVDVVANGIVQLFFHLVTGWPAYLLAGATGGVSRGMTNHFIPTKPFSKALWPNKWPKKVWGSDFGIVAVLGLLGWWASKTSSMAVFALYGAPYMVVNAWLVLITWLQHTETDVPHLDDANWSYMRGAFLTIDGNYPPLIDWLHYRIGTTHVCHHIDCTIPHYHAREVTEAIAKNFPKIYLKDPTPWHKALWRVATKCVAVQRAPGGRYTFVEP
jgi:omega-6 fatty acid desaturase (delta-12 desaturase)